MKPYKNVKSSRVESQRDGTLNTVHRSSLIVPELVGATAEISFLNHFMIKRDISQVACRITAIDQEGQRIESRLHPVNEAKVYSFTLTGMVDRPVSSYLIEFFTSDNLDYPFPAVMVNHHGPGYRNMVHAFNRVLNDVFEDDEVNNQEVAEASIDVKLDWETDTFVVFTAGFQNCKGDLRLELDTPDKIYSSSMGLDVPRFCSKEISLREVFPDAPHGCVGILKVRQPKQFMFYGRMMVGQRDLKGAISANHSYYDLSEAGECWDDDRESSRMYPYFPEHRNTIRMYPIMSPGRLDVSMRFYGRDGGLLGTTGLGELESPGRSFLNASVNDLIESQGVPSADIAVFELVCRPMSGCTPTRISHQLVWGEENLEASVNLTLNNPNAVHSPNKLGFTWGQAIIGHDVESWFGIVGSGAQGDPEVEVVFYGPDGELARRDWTLIRNSSLVVNLGQELAEELDGLPSEGSTNVWYVVRASDPEISAYSFDRHRESHNFSGEHSF